MGKVFWLVAASLVASASVIYVAADYANRHPESLLGRCVTAAIYPATVGESGSRSVTCAPKGDAAANQVSPTPPSGNSQPKLILEPVAEECPDTPVTAPAAEASEPIQVNMPLTGAATGAALGGSPALATGGDVISGGNEAADNPYCRKGGATTPEECEVVPPSMPPPPVCSPEAPSFMPPWPEGEQSQTAANQTPYAEEDPEMKEEAGCPLSAWFYWLKKMASTKEAGKKDQGQQESDLVPDASTGTSVYPGATEASDPSQPPNCQEDPDYHHQYPGCPHVGGCSGPGQCCPPPAPSVTPKVKKHPKKKKVNAMPVSRSHKAKASKAVPEENEESSPSPGVDTMECRPSDVQFDDMDPNTPH